MDCVFPRADPAHRDSGEVKQLPWNHLQWWLKHITVPATGHHATTHNDIPDH